MNRHATAFAPGRVNLIGEHTDYNLGLALPFAISQGVTVRAWALNGRRIEALATDLREQDAFELATALALLALTDVGALDRLELVKICARIESRWAGAQTGMLDQLASLFGQRGRALRIDFRSLEVRPVELGLGGFRLVTLGSGERHRNATSGYNQRRAECALACRHLGVGSLREATLAMAEELPPPLHRRARHVIAENDRVSGAVAALQRGDMAQLGALLEASHASLRDCYEASTPSVEAAASSLRRAGAVGARMIGGGFGGHVLGLLAPGASVPAGASEVRPGDGARLVELR